MQPGEIVSIAAATTPATPPPRRLDCVAFTRPEKHGGAERTAPQWLVKRVWGLPGERLMFRNGDMWIDGVLLQKSLEELEQVAVPVARFASQPQGIRSNATTSLPEHFPTPAIFPQAMLPASEAVDGSEASSEFVWEYCRSARVDPRHAAQDTWMVAAPLMDDYPHNQGVSRQLHPIGDFMLQLQWLTVLDRPITIDLQTHLARVQVVVLPFGSAFTKKTAASSKVEDKATSVGSGEGFDYRVKVEAADECTIAICDDRLLVRTASTNLTQSLDMLLVDAQTYSGEDVGRFRLRIAAKELIESIELSRDLYLYWETVEPAEWLVPSDGYFVLGDNLPVSIDSRHGTEVFPRVGKLYRLSE